LSCFWAFGGDQLTTGVIRESVRRSRRVRRLCNPFRGFDLRASGVVVIRPARRLLSARAPVWPAEDDQMTITFTPNGKGSPAGKLAEAELHFSGGPLDGLKLVGFAVWERRDGGRNVTFPSRQYTTAGERRSYTLLRPMDDSGAQERLRDLVLEAYKAHEAEMAGAEATA
jgi:hypothetical protein